MYADYIAELSHGHVLETECGFATYVYPDDKTCYLKEIYIKPEHRKQGVASSISALIEKAAKERGCSVLWGSVVPSAKGSTTSLKVLLADGFKLKSSSSDFILFEKEI